jgi:uncharacterized alkaline shock family protein YloU
MKIWSRIVGTVYVLCGLTLALGFLLLWANEQLLNKCISFWQAHTLQVGLTGMIVVLTGIVWLVNWFDLLHRNRAISFDNPGGQVRISLRAIEEFINSRILTQIPGVKGLRVRAGLSSRGIETAINLKLLAGLNIPETCANIQEITKNYLHDMVGVERVSVIEIFVSHILVRENLEALPEKETEPTADQEKPCS